VFVELLSLVVEPAFREEGVWIREDGFVAVVDVVAVADDCLTFRWLVRVRQRAILLLRVELES